MKIKLIVFALFFPLIIYGQLKFVNEFLNIGVGARAQGMFGSVVANDDGPTAAYWNTAGLSEMKAPMSITAMHANWFGDIAGYDYFTIAKRFGHNGSYGAFSFIKFGVDNIPNTLNLVQPDGTINFDKVTQFSVSDYAFILSYAKKIGTLDNLSIGGNIKVIRRKIGDFGGAWGIGSDIGIKYRFNANLKFGLMIRDVTTTFNAWSFTISEEDKLILAQTGNDIPVSSTETTLPRMIFGSAYTFNFGSKSRLLTELDLNLSTNGTKSGILSSNKFSVDPTFGLEFAYVEKVFLRAGLGNIQRTLNEVNANKSELDFQPNVGIGVRLGRFYLDYALANMGSVGGVLPSNIFSLRLDLTERK